MRKLREYFDDLNLYEFDLNRVVLGRERKGRVRRERRRRGVDDKNVKGATKNEEWVM